MVRHGSAKAVFVGSIPTLASKFLRLSLQGSKKRESMQGYGDLILIDPFALAKDQIKSQSQHDRIDKKHQPCGCFLNRCDRTGFGFQVFHVAVKVDHRGEDQPNPESENHSRQVVY